VAGLRHGRIGPGPLTGTGYAELPNEVVSAANGVEYAYRDTGGGAGREGAVPLVLFQHFRGNLDGWDPALIDALATTRRVVTFDNAGVGGSTGTTPATIEQMGRDAIAFIAALGIGQADLLGFSIGSFVAQQIALQRPALVRRLALASSAPQGAAGMHGWAPEVIGAVGTPKTSPSAYLGVFFTPSALSQQAGQEALRRMFARTQDGIRPPRGRPARRSTTRSAPGAFRITACCSGWGASRCRCSWRTGTAIR
jgi:pimeloyl-ACP methyl ester carboxylesterase